MLSVQVEVLNKLGLHTRAAAELVRAASKFESKITIRKDDRTADAKGIMGLLMLAATQGTVLELTFEGADEAESCASIVELFNNRFGELE